MQTIARPASRFLGRGRRIIDAGVRDQSEAYYATLLHLHPARKQSLYTADMLARVGRQASPPLQHLRMARHGALLDSLLDADVNHYLPDDLLVKMDVATMAYSLEGRSPLLDHRLMEFMARVPASMKLRGGESKHLLKSALRGIVPDAVLDRPKMGFGVPLAEWLRGSLKELLLDTVLSRSATERGYFQPAAVRRMVDAHMSGSDDYKYVLWDLLLLERWHRKFIDPVMSAPSKAIALASN
jgi:asparagine synthase (glutamine-hydrolysing)